MHWIHRNQFFFVAVKLRLLRKIIADLLCDETQALDWQEKIYLEQMDSRITKLLSHLDDRLFGIYMNDKDTERLKKLFYGTEEEPISKAAIAYITKLFQKGT